MDLPVDEWKSYILQKWSLLPTAVQLTIATAETLSDVFLLSSSLLQPEDEMFLKSLSRGYFVGKDPAAPLFYREEGNKKFQGKDYTGAAVLYSKLSFLRMRTWEAAVMAHILGPCHPRGRPGWSSELLASALAMVGIWGV